MEEKYKYMLAALSAAVANLDNIFTASEFNNNMALLSNVKRSVDMLGQTIALRDCILRINELFWLIGNVDFDLNKPKKHNLQYALNILSTNQAVYSEYLHQWGDNVVSINLHSAFSTKVKVPALLEEITDLCQILSKNYLAERI